MTLQCPMCWQFQRERVPLDSATCPRHGRLDRVSLHVQNPETGEWESITATRNKTELPSSTK